MDDDIIQHGIEVGDTVRLKSIGPIMTVEFVEGDKIKCIWYCEVHDKFRVRKLSAWTLNKVESPTDEPAESGQN